MFYPTSEEFALILRFLNEYQLRENREGKLTARNPVTQVEYSAYLGGVKIYESKVHYYGAVEVRDILDKPLRIDSSTTFAWALFCKLKQRQELLFR